MVFIVITFILIIFIRFINMNNNQEVQANYMLLAVSQRLGQAEVFSNCQPYFSHIYVYCSFFNVANLNQIKSKVYGIYLGAMYVRKVI